MLWWRIVGEQVMITVPVWYKTSWWNEMTSFDDLSDDIGEWMYPSLVCYISKLELILFLWEVCLYLNWM